MISRLKLPLFLVVFVSLGALLAQNQQPLELKFFCADVSQLCWYQTAPLSLSLWMGLFMLGGVITSWLWQGLNHLGYSSWNQNHSSRSNYVESGDLASSSPRYNHSHNRQSASWEEQPISSGSGSADDAPESSSIYEKRSKPQTVQRSGSTYSYKFKEARDPANAIPQARENKLDTKPETSKNSSLEGTEGTKTEDDEDWI